MWRIMPAFMGEILVMFSIQKMLQDHITLNMDTLPQAVARLLADTCFYTQQSNRFPKPRDI